MCLHNISEANGKENKAWQARFTGAHRSCSFSVFLDDLKIATLDERESGCYGLIVFGGGGGSRLLKEQTRIFIISVS